MKLQCGNEHETFLSPDSRMIIFLFFSIYIYFFSSSHKKKTQQRRRLSSSVAGWRFALFFLVVSAEIRQRTERELTTGAVSWDFETERGERIALSWTKSQRAEQTRKWDI